MRHTKFAGLSENARNQIMLCIS